MLKAVKNIENLVKTTSLNYYIAACLDSIVVEARHANEFKCKILFIDC